MKQDKPDDRKPGQAAPDEAEHGLVGSPLGTPAFDIGLPSPFSRSSVQVRITLDRGTRELQRALGHSLKLARSACLRRLLTDLHRDPSLYGRFVEFWRTEFVDASCVDTFLMYYLDYETNAILAHLAEELQILGRSYPIPSKSKAVRVVIRFFAREAGMPLPPTLQTEGC